MKQIFTGYLLDVGVKIQIHILRMHFKSAKGVRWVVINAFSGNLRLFQFVTNESKVVHILTV